MSERKAKAAIIVVSLSLLIYGLACVYSPISWSPDSSKIAALHLGREGDEARFEIWITDVRNGESELLVSSETGLSAPAWSPDGEKIAYLQLVQEEGPEANVYVESLADGSRRRLASIKTMKEGGDVFVTLFMLLPSWSPDGRKIVLGCYDEEDKPFVGVIDAESGEMKNILKNAAWPVWSPDGKRIACFSGEEPDITKLIIVRPDGKEKKVLVDVGEAENRGLGGYYPVWAPDSASIIYLVGVKAEEEVYALYMVDLEGREKEIVQMESDIGLIPAISPDGKRVAFGVGLKAKEPEQKEIFELHLMDLETGEKKILAQSFEVLTMPSFSPDGRFLACRFGMVGEEQDAASLIKILDLETEEEKVIAVNSYETALLAAHYFGLGQGLAEAGEEEGGRDLFEKAAEVTGEYLDKYVDFESLESVLELRAASLKELGKFEGAISQFKLLLALYEYRGAGKAEVLQAKFEMAECYEALEKKSEAARIYEQIVSEIPEDTEEEALRELRQKAAEKLEKLTQESP